MSACIDTNPATDALAEILYDLIELNEGGNTLAEDAKIVVDLFRRIDDDFAKWTLEKLELEYVDQKSAKDLYRALQKIAKIGISLQGCDNEHPCAFESAVKIAEEAMKKARGEK